MSERQNENTEKLELPVDDGTTLGLFVARPSGPPRGGLMVLQEIFGVNAHMRDVAQRFAREGFLVAVPDLFHREGAWFESGYDDYLPGLTRANATTQPMIRADLRATHAWLSAELARAGAASARVGAIGFCMGGRQAYVANGILPLSCAISLYGSNIRGLPDLAPTQSGPLLVVWGGRDGMIDAAQRRETADLLTAAEKPFVEVNFADADHGFFCDARSNHHPPSAKQVWALIQAFLSSHLG